MFRGVSLSPGDVVVEYGPGTGSFTLEIERRRLAGERVRYLGVEKDPGLYRFLVRRFPDLDFVLGDAVDAAEFHAARGLAPARAVISGLPLIFMNRRTLEGIFSATSACLRPDGLFRTFSYVHSYPTRSAGALRDLMVERFEECHLSRPVLRNLPPAYLLTGRSPRVGSVPSAADAMAG